MKKMSKLTSVALLSTTLLTSTLSLTNTTVSATTSVLEVQYSKPSSTNSSERSENKLTDSEINEIDKYIRVKNNQYVLNDSNNSELTEGEITVAKKVIEESNQDIKNNHEVINPITKTIDEKNNPININSRFTILARSSKNSRYTWKKFWWGTRYYFRSNAAVYQMDHELDDYSLACGVVGTIGALASAGTASAVGGLSAAYFQKIKSDLDYMNNTHPHNYLYMDVNRTGIYSIKVLK